MKSNKLLAVLFVLVLPATACGGGDSSDTTGPDSGQTSGDGSSGNGGSDDGGTGGDSDGSSSSGNSEPPGSLSEDFAVGIAPGWVFDVLGDIGMTNTTGAQLYYPEGAFDDVVAYYDDWTGSQSVEYARTELNGDVVYQSTEVPIVLITVTPSFEERGETYTYLLIAVGDDS